MFVSTVIRVDLRDATSHSAFSISCCHNPERQRTNFADRSTANLFVEECRWSFDVRATCSGLTIYFCTVRSRLNNLPIFIKVYNERMKRFDTFVCIFLSFASRLISKWYRCTLMQRATPWLHAWSKFARYRVSMYEFIRSSHLLHSCRHVCIINTR